jgi:hypothetical protein
MMPHSRQPLALLLFCLLSFAAACGGAASHNAGNDASENPDDDENNDNTADDDDDASPLACWDEPGDSATSAGMTPRQAPAYYVAQSLKYFATLDSDADPRNIPNYSELVARWEWPPWLKLTGLGDRAMVVIDLLLRLYPTTIPEHDCEAFPVQPFGRCHVVFHYQDTPCAIYEEFTFNDQGQMTFIEAWSDIPGLLPTTDPNDYWAEGAGVHRLSTKIPGLGGADGLINLDSACMQQAADQDADVADFLKRAKSPIRSWIEQFLISGKDMMQLGCK